MSHFKAILRIFHTGIRPHCWERGLAHSHLKSCVEMIVANMGHGLDQRSVPTKTAYHALEGGRSPAAISCGASEPWEDTEMWAGRNGLWFQFEGREKDTFLVVVLAASLVPFLPDLLLGVGHLTPNLFLQQLLAVKHVSTHPQWLLLQGLQCLLQLAPLQQRHLHHRLLPENPLPTCPRALKQSILSLSNSGALGHIPFPKRGHRWDYCEKNSLLPKESSPLVPLIIICYL